MKISANEIVFIVGAGISNLSPSNIPLGYELTKFILEESCGKMETECIFDLWSEFSDVISKYDDKLKFPIPRLEMILGCINEIDKLTHRRSILHGLKSFSDIPFNINHEILAQFLLNGSNILTTNFDLGIENALKKCKKNLTYTAHNNLSIFSVKNAGSIYHLHGSANDDLNILGATVEKVKSGFDNDEKFIVNRLIKESKLLVFLGYSISDSFDITPYFEELDFKINNMIFVQHSIDNKKCDYPINIDKVAMVSINTEKIMCNTTDFLKDFAKKTINISDLNLYSPENYDWKQAFYKQWNYKYNDDEKLLNLLGIRYHVGFNTRILKNVRPNIFNEIKEYKEKYNHCNRRLNEYPDEALRSFDTLIKKDLIKPTQFVDKKVDYIDRDYLLVLSKECEYYYLKYRNPTSTISANDKKRILFLISLLEDYSTYSFSQVQYISYLMSFLKHLAFFYSRFNKEYHPEISKRELLLSLDITYIEGSIAALTHYAQHCIYLKELNNTNKYDVEIKKTLQSAYDLSVLSGYFYHCEIIKNLINDFECQYD